MTNFDPCPLPIATPVALMQDSAKSGAAPARGRCKMKGFFNHLRMRKCLLALLLLALLLLCCYTKVPQESFGQVKAHALELVS